VATVWVVAREIALDEIRDPLTVPIDCICDDSEFGGDGRQIS
jgi:hypothetical protein